VHIRALCKSFGFQGDVFATANYHCLLFLISNLSANELRQSEVTSIKMWSSESLTTCYELPDSGC